MKQEDCPVLILGRTLTMRAVLRRVVSHPGKGIFCIAEAETLEEALRLISTREPGVLLIDSDTFDQDQLEEFSRSPVLAGLKLLCLRSDVHSPTSDGMMILLPKPRTPGDWEELVSAMPAILHGFPETEIEKNSHPLEILAIGASAGGPAAIMELLQTLGDDLNRLSVIVIQHIGKGFEIDFVNWLKRNFPDLRIGLAREKQRPRAGHLVIAGSGRHLFLDGDGLIRIDDSMPPIHGHKPSIDVFFQSLSQWKGINRVAAVLLSGMGSDGAFGLKQLRDAGALTLVQDLDSSIVYGMPRVAWESGAAEKAMNPAEIGLLIKERLKEIT